MIHIKEISKDNCLDVAELTGNKDGVATVFEEYVCCNALSIMEAQYFPGLVPKALYADEQLIGFFMYERTEDKPEHAEIWRFMLDHKFIGRGLGRASFAAILAYLKEAQYRTIDIVLEDENHIAKSLYTSFGFEFNGRIVDDEHYYSLVV